MIRIAHLYYDLLNLYGESGNVKAVKNYIEKQGVSVKVECVTIKEKIDFSNYDFIYIGMGTEHNQKLALEHLLSCQEEVKKYIENGGYFLATGNSIELFGNKIIDKDSNEYEALNIFDFTSLEQSERIVCETIGSCNYLKKEVIGFQNRSGIINTNNESLFTITKGIGSNYDTDCEGIYYKNFFGTYLIGPILVRNPHLLEYICKSLIKSKNKKFKFKRVDFVFENKAYENNLKLYSGNE